MFRELATRLREGVLLISEDGELAFANDAALRLFAVPNAEVLRERWPESRRRIETRLAAAAERDALSDVRLPVDTRSEIHLQLSRIHEEDFIGYLALVRADGAGFPRDLRTVSHYRSVATFFSQLIHDVRAPLSAMRIHVDLLRESLKSEARSEQGASAKPDRHLLALDRELVRLARGLDQLDGLRAREGGADAFDVADVVRGTLALIRSYAERRQIEILAEVQDGVVVSGGRELVEIALLNVVVNALEAVGQRGILRLSLRSEGALAICTVRDSGPGIPQAIRDRIFDPDFTTKPEVDAGLGLPVARQSLESLGGRLGFEPEPEGGSCFTLEIPCGVRST